VIRIDANPSEIIGLNYWEIFTKKKEKMLAKGALGQPQVRP